MIKIVGFIGLGVMGHNMALNLAQKMPAGVKLIVFDVDKAKTEALVKAAETRGAAAAGASSITDMGSTDLIFLSLPNSSIVQNVITSLSPILKSGSIIADTSTTEVTVVKVLALELEKMGIDFADTPVSGGEKAAIDGTLSFMAGAKEEVFAEIKPFCSTMAASVVHMGGVGTGQTAKAVNQMIVGAAFAVIAESFSLGARSGLDPKILYEAIKGGWAGSKVLDVAAKDMLSRDFKPGGTVDIHWKDLGYALNLSKDTDTPVPVTALVHEIFKASRAHGDGKKSQPAIVKLWESLLNQEVK
ncbi:NAD(P)-dependent oxidoreductase [Leadbettera azotonutricia]|uniref:3-hydroxyisobutyrate dehydrogenase n=1 Tax=Leadbettera azotonutricia (strain ATCC BAA-888 / DSM 13862 / ZAS-9) TaxID=545695 RepID=F5YGB8_LEAAZ|nr:prephenate dehydrogenase/arogenate dehydrogenase family protein [Leadbettera azotonutricia]AEF81072.1 3-hydroxyisobutyrate dehydrogenase [Leadbettera azotonutricia ZAS-9]